MLGIELLQSVAIAILSVVAAWSDIRRRTIANWLCLLTACIGLAFAFGFDGWDAALWHAAHMMVALLIGMGLFAMQWWGGGDGKFYAAVAAWVPLSGFFLLLLWIALAGFLLVAVIFILRRIGPPVERPEGQSLPYGVAIAAGILCTLLPVYWPN